MLKEAKDAFKDVGRINITRNMVLERANTCCITVQSLLGKYRTQPV